MGAPDYAMTGLYLNWTQLGPAMRNREAFRILNNGPREW
jgi:hypothetical protein